MTGISPSERFVTCWLLALGPELNKQLVEHLRHGYPIVLASDDSATLADTADDRLVSDPQPTRVTADDALMARRLLRSAHGDGVELRGPGPSDAVSVTYQDLGRIRLIHYRSQAELHWHVPRLSRLVLVQPLAGRLRRDRPGASDQIGPGEVAVLAPPQQQFDGVNSGLTYRAVSIDLSLLAEVVGWRAPSPTGNLIEWHHCRPLAPAGMNRWCRIVDVVEDALAAGSGQGSLRRNAEPFVAAALLSLLSQPGHGEEEPDVDDSTPLTVKRSIEFIEVHADQAELTVADVAAATKVSVRAIQLAFRRHLDTTPLAYMRKVRLQRAHDELRAADPGQGDTVTEIAARWGFFNPGRFSGQYRALFGVPPSQTLRS